MFRLCFCGLHVGKTLTWEEAKKVSAYIKKHGIIQLLEIYHERKDWNYRVLLWGDEIEYVVVKFDHAARTVKLSLRSHELLPVLQEPERENAASAPSLWRPEYGRFVRAVLCALRVRRRGILFVSRWLVLLASARLMPLSRRSFMIEGTPGTPYIGDPNLFVYQVELSMAQRRRLAQVRYVDSRTPSHFPCTLSCHLGAVLLLLLLYSFAAHYASQRELALNHEFSVAGHGLVHCTASERWCVPV